MQKHVTLMLALLSLICSTQILGCTRQSAHEEPKLMTARETMGLVSNGFAVLVDVREKDEVVDDGVAAPATLIPNSEIEKDEMALKKFAEATPKDKTVVFYCISGRRAKSAAEKLSAMGYKTAYFKSFYEWKNEGLPIKPATH